MWLLQPTFAAALALTLAASSALAEPAAVTERPVVISLPAALAYARVHQPSLTAARARLLAAQRESDVPRAEWAPRIGGLAEVVGATVNNSTATFLTDPSVSLARVGSSHFDGTGSPPDWQPYATTVLAVGVRQEVYDFGRIAAQSATLGALADVERARVRATQLDLDFAVADSFYAVLAAHGVLEAAAQAETRSRAHLDFEASAVAAGLRDPIAKTRAEADLARFEVGRVRAARSLRIARIALAAAIGSPQTELDAETTTEGPPPPIPSGDQAAARAVDHEPTVAALEAQVRSQDLGARAISALLRPNLYLSAAFSMRGGGGPASSATAKSATYNGFLPETPNYDAGLVLSIPLFDAAIDKRAAAASARADALRADTEAYKIRVRQAAREAVERVRQREETLVALERAGQAARANADQAEARERNGLGTSTELADAEALRADAEIQLTIGRFQLRTARSGLARRIAENP